MPIQNIVVGVTDSDTSQTAALTAVEYAKACGATLHFVTAVRKQQPEVIEMEGERWEFSSAEYALRGVTRFVQSLALQLEHTIAALQGEPAEVLVQEAERLDAELIVVGNVRMRGAGRVLGSVGAHVLRHAPGDVLVVRTT